MYGTGSAILSSAGLIKADGGTAIHIYGRGTGSNLGQIDVSGTGFGVYIDGAGTGSNSGNISVSDTGIAMQSINGGILTNTGKITMEPLTEAKNGGVAMSVNGTGTATNTGVIEIGSGQVGMYSKNGALIVNTGTIDSNNGVGMYMDGNSNYSNEGEVLVEGNGVGLTSNGTGIITNNSSIDITKSGTGMLSTNGTTLINKGSIKLGIVKPTIKPLNNEILQETEQTDDLAIGMGVNGQATAINEGTISTLTKQIGMYGSNGAILENKGTISTNGGIGMQLNGLGKVTNEGSIITVSNSGTGIYINGNGNAENLSSIKISSQSTGMSVTNGGTITNSGTITIETDKNTKETNFNKGMEALSNGTIINNGVIDINSSKSIGIYISGENVSATNESKIDINSENSVAMASSGKNVLVNNKYIFIKDGLENAYAFSLNGGSVQNIGSVSLGTTGQMYAGSGEFFNAGTISGSPSELIKLSTNNNFIMEKNGEVSNLDGTSYKLKNAVLGLSYMPNIFSEGDTLTKSTELNFETENISSYSNMYDVIKTNDGVYVRRKRFSEISDSGLGNYLEDLYISKDNINANELYTALRSARLQDQFDQHLDNFFGRKIYPMIIFQTRDAINFTTNNILDNLETRYNLDKSESYIVGYSLERFKKGGFDRSVGYDEYLNGFYLGKQYRFNNESDYGFIFSYTRLDSKYKSDAGKRESNFFQGTAFMNYSKDQVKGIGTLYMGYGYGDIKRNMNVEYMKFEENEISYWEIKEKYNANLKNFYLGTSGKISKEYNFGTFFIEPEIKAGVMSVFQKSIHESGGEYALDLERLERIFGNIKAEANIGKIFYPKIDYKLTLKLKGALAQDMNSENDNLKLKLKNISNEKGELKVDRRDQFSQELGIRADLQKNLKEELSFYLDYKYIFENQNSWKISTGFVYAF